MKSTSSFDKPSLAQQFVNLIPTCGMENLQSILVNIVGTNHLLTPMVPQKDSKNPTTPKHTDSICLSYDIQQYRSEISRKR